MDDPNKKYVNKFIQINRLYYYYLLMSHLSLISFFYIFWVVMSNTIRGDQIYLLFSIEIILVQLPIIPISIKLFDRSQELYRFLNLKDIKKYGIDQLLSNLIISSIIILCFFGSILAPYSNNEMWNSADPPILYPLNRLYNPLSADLFQFAADFLFALLVMNSGVIFCFIPLQIINNLIILLLFVWGLIKNAETYVLLKRILLRLIRNKLDYKNVVTKCKKLSYSLVLFWIAFGVMCVFLGLERWGLSDSRSVFSNFTGFIVFYFLILINSITILNKIKAVPLNLNLNTYLSQKLYKLEKDVNFSERALFFEPKYLGNHGIQSNGWGPKTGIIVLVVAGVIIVFIIPMLIPVVRSVSYYYYGSNYEFVSSLIFNIIYTVCFLIGLFGLLIPLSFFQIERTPTEMIFQKGYKKDHIPLAQLQEIALDYDFINKRDAINTTSVKLRITIALLIPNHTVCITRNIKMDFVRNNQESFESQLVKILTKTLFILGYTTN